ncbi:MAG: DUF2254 domain-containing protein [Hoeflea sp.]|uniref:DUF2254 domain-containing protein n=1 Tax=Hoeflea sp. TaxID=1940281 RepID=UPI001D40AA20|nr:DUF2254 domain-containing protein [Hoeflea sp.]MBU4530620.1 DUF2254 domain-containing protein [Alphaproteobacteria bacterium]MBU4544840.1 DUF2254 domain-containing protein [Alphaproteobacteria bacterium]MBU4551983.1 DUF2254 domain-containing protein [Alphaproteobacteria bacterium]MBV1722172.1 DUF2254 domain-containing protein [Hoeflea sp.]MBV1761734.1 DUF2254 domain-containing protein [Hoeflea sp.]
MRFFYNSLNDYLAERLWLRPALFGLMAVLVVAAATAVDQVFGQPFSFDIKKETIDNLLTIMATAMLTVATFAASVMLSAYVAAVSASTPRAFSIVVADSTSKQAISTFISAFTFSVVGLIGLNVGFIQATGRILLFFATLSVFTIVVVTLIYWIDHVARISTVTSTIDKVSTRATNMLARHLTHPGHGGTPIFANTAPPDGAMAILSMHTGTVQFIDVDALSDLADEIGVTIHVAVRMGDLVGQGREVAWVYGGDGKPVDDAATRRISGAIRIGESRHRSEDPVLALKTLSEIGDRALSPGINDPGTANDILDALVQVFANAAKSSNGTGTATQHPRVLVPIVEPEIILTAAFEQIARDGAGSVEVAVHLQHALSAIACCVPAIWEVALREQSARALDRARAALTYPHDLRRVEEAAMLASRL